MNSKINHQTDVCHTGNMQSPSNPLTFPLAPLSSFVTHLGPVARGSLMLLVLLLVAVPSLAMLFPRTVTPASASTDQFSGERAMVHLPIIASQPHPQGSPALARVRDYLARQLTDMGLEVQVQQAGGLKNVVARLPGTDPTGAIIIFTHYDTISYSPGAGDNSSAVAALLEIMHSLAAGPVPRNDVIALFHDGEEPGSFAGTRAFMREHPWMSDVRVAISIDGAVAGFISTNEVGPQNNGWLVHTLAQAYSGGTWMSMSGGGIYNSTPFREAGIPVITLEDNYPFRQKHTGEDLPQIINPGTVQQMGEQTVAIARELGNLDLAHPWGRQETFFSVPVIGFIHYPQAWSLPLAITTGLVLVLTLGMALSSRFVSWRGLAVAFGTTLTTAMLSVIVVGALQPQLPGLFGWKTSLWQEWPEVIPPYGGLAAGALGLLVLGMAVGSYLLARRWSAQADFSLIGLLPFLLSAVALAIAEPRAAYAFIWPVLISSLVWIVAVIARRRQMKWSMDLAATLAAAPLVIMFTPFMPGLIMSDGMKSLNILAGIEVLLLAVIFPALEGLLVRDTSELST
ncbi:MAG TPA: M28 family peptidase [Anaerolineales bacterium]|nr:M28 family peptidase [Anaerolineales bacterium]